MNFNLKKIIPFLILIIGASFGSNGQLLMSDFEFGVKPGILVDQGDLTPKFYGHIRTLHPAIGIYAGKWIGEHWQVRGNLTIGSFSSDDSKYSNPSWRQQRNFNFNTKIGEFSGLVVLHPLGQHNRFGYRKFSNYYFGGIGLAFLDIDRDWSNFNADFGWQQWVIDGLQRDEAHLPPKILPVVPLGIGFSYGLNVHWAVNFEFCYRFTSSDYIDGFKYAVNPNRKDSYYGITLGVCYRPERSRFKCSR